MINTLDLPVQKSIKCCGITVFSKKKQSLKPGMTDIFLAAEEIYNPWSVGQLYCTGVYSERHNWVNTGKEMKFWKEVLKAATEDVIEKL